MKRKVCLYTNKSILEQFDDKFYKTHPNPSLSSPHIWGVLQIFLNLTDYIGISEYSCKINFDDFILKLLYFFLLFDEKHDLGVFFPNVFPKHMVMELAIVELLL